MMLWFYEFMIQSGHRENEHPVFQNVMNLWSYTRYRRTIKIKHISDLPCIPHPRHLNNNITQSTINNNSDISTHK